MKKLSLLLCLLISFTVLLCGCSGGTRLNRITGVSADDIEAILCHYAKQSSVQVIKESCYDVFFFYVNVRYEENSSLDYGDDYMCYNVILKDNKTIDMYYLSNRKMHVDYFDGENSYCYVSCGKVYIPWYAVQLE